MAERAAGGEVASREQAGEQVEQRVGTRATADALEVLRVDRQVALAGAGQRSDHAVDPGLVDGLQVLGEEGLRRAGEATAQRGVHVPVERLVRLWAVDEPAAAVVQVPGDHGDRVAAHQHAVVVQAEPAAGELVQEVVDVVQGLVERVLEGRGRDVFEGGERRATGRDRVDVAQEPVGGELVARVAPAVQVATHGRAGVAPLGADPRQREVTLGQLGTAGVDPVEDVDDDVDGLVGAGDGLDVEGALQDVAQPCDPVDVLGEPVTGLVVRAEQGIGRTRAVDEQRGDVDPPRVALHLDRRVELERPRSRR